jgi:hypothetical protein
MTPCCPNKIKFKSANCSIHYHYLVLTKDFRSKQQLQLKRYEEQSAVSAANGGCCCDELLQTAAASAANGNLYTLNL